MISYFPWILSRSSPCCPRPLQGDAIIVQHGGSPLILRDLFAMRKLNIRTRQWVERLLPGRLSMKFRALLNPPLNMTPYE